MAENINISFAPNKSASESQRIADLEQYVSTLTERTKFAFASIIEEYNGADTDKTQQILNTIYQSTSESGSDVGKFTNTDKNCEIFNDYANNVAQAYYSHAEGYSTVASAPYTHAEGYMTQATAPSAHAEGYESKAINNYAHAEGKNTQSTSYASHAEGENTVASGWISHAEGQNTVADGMYSHAEGSGSKAIGGNSHAGGMNSEAIGTYSFTHGYGTKTSYTCGTALGISNKTQNALFVIGNGGWWEGGESDALTLTETGMLWIEGSFEASAQHGGLGISVHGAARFGDNWTSDGVDTLLAVGNGYDSERTRDALTLDKNGNLYISGKLTADGGIDIPIATAESVGGVKIGDNLTISEDGTLSANSGGYTLPVATADTLGGVKIGDNITVTDDGTISVDLSAYLKSADISDWAKQSDKPTYTANEIGLGNVDNTADADKPISTATQKALDGKADTGHTHTVSDITDMPAYLTEETDPTVPAWAKAESKPVYTAEEVGAVTAEDMDAKTYLKAVDIKGQTVDLNDYKLNQPADKGKSVRHFCSVANSGNITNRPVSVNEPFELVTTNIRYVSTGAYHTVQKYTSATRQRTYARWCANGTWSAWKCDTDVVVYGSVTADSPKTFAYATYGEGFGVVEIEAYYDNATNPVRNRKVFALSPTASIERVMLTISNGSSESVTLANGSITMSMTGTTALSFMIRYTNSR
ncbi:MAG: hypothetical protein ACI4JV_00245 [Ruminiclostridium sp.]